MDPRKAPADPRACAVLAAKIANDEKATDIMVQEVSDLMSATDYFVIATAANYRHVEAIIEKIEEGLRTQLGAKPLHVEGLEGASWALLDYGSLIIHVFQPEARDHYRLESLWSDAPLVDLVAEGIIDAEYSDRIAKLIARSKEQGSVIDLDEEIR